MSGICLECGLCCDGTVFVEVHIRDGDDMGPLLALGTPVTRGPDDATFPQPCRALVSRCCTVYADRPGACRDYRCALLAGLDAGEVAPEDARSRVAAARELSATVRTRLEAILGSPPGRPLDHLAKDLNARIASDPDPAASRIAHADVIADVLALDMTLDRHFRVRHREPT